MKPAILPPPGAYPVICLLIIFYPGKVVPDRLYGRFTIFGVEQCGEIRIMRELFSRVYPSIRALRSLKDTLPVVQSISHKANLPVSMGDSSLV
jgi:hypothetical protein